MKTFREKAALWIHHSKVSGMKLAARMGFKKYREMVDGPATDMTNDRATKRFIKHYIQPEDTAVRKWVELGNGKTYLDVGAGSGRFSKIVLESGASRVAAVDINPKCIEVLNLRFKEESRFEAKLADATLLPYDNNSFDRVLCLGNTLGNMFYAWPGVENSFQAEVLREMMRVAKECVVLTLQRKSALRIALQYYRMNGYDVYSYENGIARLREKHVTPHGSVYTSESRSQKFDPEDILKIVEKAGISQKCVDISPINKYNWFVVIRKS